MIRSCLGFSHRQQKEDDREFVEDRKEGISSLAFDKQASETWSWRIVLSDQNTMRSQNLWQIAMICSIGDDKEGSEKF